MDSADAPLRRNDNWTTNPPPATPTALASAVGGNAVTLRWAAATDPNQPAGLTYNLRVGTASGSGNVVSPMSVPGTGFRQVCQPGNAGGRLDASLRGLAPGTYYWSVQAIDHNHEERGTGQTRNGSKYKHS